MSRIAKFVCVEFRVFEMKLLGRALDGMEGGPVFVRMDKLESDKSNIRSLGNIIIVFQDGVQSTLNCSRLTDVPSRFGIARVPSPGNLGLIWNLKFGKIRVHGSNPCACGLALKALFNRWLQVANRNSSTVTCLNGFAAEDAWNGRLALDDYGVAIAAVLKKQSRYQHSF